MFQEIPILYDKCKCGTLYYAYKTAPELFQYDSLGSCLFVKGDEKSSLILNFCPSCGGLDTLSCYESLTSESLDLCSCEALENWMEKFPSTIWFHKSNDGFIFGSRENPSISVTWCPNCGKLLKDKSEDFNWCQKPDHREVKSALELISKLKEIKETNQLQDLLGTPDDGQFVTNFSGTCEDEVSVLVHHYSFSSLFRTFVFLVNHYSNGEFSGAIIFKQK